MALLKGVPFCILFIVFISYSIHHFEPISSILYDFRAVNFLVPKGTPFCIFSTWAATWRFRIRMHDSRKWKLAFRTPSPRQLQLFSRPSTAGRRRGSSRAGAWTGVQSALRALLQPLCPRPDAGVCSRARSPRRSSAPIKLSR